MANGHRPHEGDERGPPLRENGTANVPPLEVGSEELHAFSNSSELRRAVFSNVLRKTGYGLASGLLLGLFVFRRTPDAIQQF